MQNQFTTFNHFRGESTEEIQNQVGEKIQGLSIKQPVRLPQEIVKIIHDRIGGEYHAHYAYRAAANWCKNVNYKKAAAFFEKGAEEELEHAKDLQDYLTQWNILPDIPSVNPHFQFQNLIQIIEEIYDVECKLLLDYSKNAISVLDNHTATFNFFQKYIDIQNQAVAEISDLLNALCLINVQNKLDLLIFEERYF